MIVDCAYMAVRTPSCDDMQGLYYTGYKKIHALKLTILVSTSRKCIVDIFYSAGRTPDLKAFESELEIYSFLEDPELDDIIQKEYGITDKAYIKKDSRFLTPMNKVQISCAVKALKGSEKEKNVRNSYGGFNKQHSTHRILVENVIGDLSNWWAFKGSTRKSFCDNVDGLSRLLKVVQGIQNFIYVLREQNIIPNELHKNGFN
eukprot:Pgem_evm2s14645